MSFDYRKKNKDFALIFITRIFRMVSYGMLSVIFVQNLLQKGITQIQVGWIQSAIVFGDIILSLILTTQADRIGRINTLMLGSLLKLVTGMIYAEANILWVLLVTGILGVISVSGGQIGPFMPIQQSVLTQLVEECSDGAQSLASNVSKVFGYYNMAGYISQAFGAAFAGWYMRYSIGNGLNDDQATSNVVRLYAIFGGLKFIGYCMMNRDQVQPRQVKDKKVLNCTGIQRHNIGTILTLSALFAVDAFAGAFVIQSFLSFYYQQRYAFFFDKIGLVIFACNIVSGISGVLSSKLVDRIGAMATMIYTHLPSNVFLILIALTNDSFYSILFLLCRFCISQMDVPARQTYVAMVVSSSQRSAANGITNIARSVGLTAGLFINGYFMNLSFDSQYFSYPFLIAGGLKIIYDITIGCCFLWRQRKEKKVEITQLKSTEMVETSSHQSSEI